MKDQMDGLDIYVAGKTTVNFVFDRYMSLKNNLKPTTKSNYLYMYDRFIRDTFGKRNIAEIKYSDVVQFYNHLTKKQELKINTLETIHTLLHPTFQLAVRDDIIRKNPNEIDNFHLMEKAKIIHALYHIVFVYFLEVCQATWRLSNLRYHLSLLFRNTST